MANGIDGHTPVSLNTAAQAVGAIVALTVFVLTMKYTQDSQNARIDNLSQEVSMLRAEVKEQRVDIDDWKRATTGLMFKRRGGANGQVSP